MDEFTGIGDNLKQLRKQMNLSLSEVSRLTNVSKTMLSQIERNESTPTISTVWKIANGLKIKFDTLLDTSAARLCDIRSIHDMVPLRDKSHLAEIYCMAPFSPKSGYEFFYCIFRPGCNYISDGHRNSQSELVFVFQGELEIVIGTNSYRIPEGSAISIEAVMPHRYINNGETTVISCSLVSYN
ncbi:XRE family transcriptional regulator [Cloacibacillus sp. An23]|uniref:helix-turn-helix domain-containing protein n=1 Tax=Cloacibacillus sp. An23 TaxID=1965591 RepID=UPI000B39BD12|nr:XRE family transcriptional regulator [Cloacibacillus sp. An23]OUO93404.1 hypothetical protein B5F39_06765 [Cloacibacillus sp. An23]